MVEPEASSSSAPPRDPPTYDDATVAQGHRPSSSTGLYDHPSSSHHVNDDDPRQPFLDPGGSSSSRPTTTSSMRGYRPPTVETPRSSEDTADFLSPESGSARSSLEGMRSQMVQMDISDENGHESSDWASKRLRLRDQLSRRLTRFTRTVSSIRRRFPSFRWPSFEFPRIPRPTGLHLLAPVLALVLLLAGTIFLMSVSLTIPKNGGAWGGKPNAELVRSFVQGHVNPDRIRRVLERITAFDHVAGTRGDYASAKYVRAHFENARLEDVHLKE